MRQARIRPNDADTVMHVFNRVSGPVGEYPFEPADTRASGASGRRTETQADGLQSIRLDF